MKIAGYYCPYCGHELKTSLFGNSLESQCSCPITSYPIDQGIPRFVPRDNYADSFGFQWNHFDTTQLDGFCNTSLSFQRFFYESGWSTSQLDQHLLLEVGSGAGRFSEIILNHTNAILYSVDYSNAVFANLRNNTGYDNRFFLSQASIYNLPFRDSTFDFVLCLGVLQHTPSVSQAIAALVSKAKPGAQIVVDFYPMNGWHTLVHSKYILRPLTKRLPKRFLLSIITLNIRWLIWLFDIMCRCKLSALTRFLPITDLRGFPSTLSSSERRSWAIMDTFDAFSPEYDSPQQVSKIVKYFQDNNCTVTYAGKINYPDGSSTVVRAFKR